VADVPRLTKSQSSTKCINEPSQFNAYAHRESEVVRPTAKMIGGGRRLNSERPWRHGGAVFAARLSIWSGNGHDVVEAQNNNIPIQNQAAQSNRGAQLTTTREPARFNAAGAVIYNCAFLKHVAHIALFHGPVVGATACRVVAASTHTLHNYAVIDVRHDCWDC
jgi:hypothetical protein